MDKIIFNRRTTFKKTCCSSRIKRVDVWSFFRVFDILILGCFLGLAAKIAPKCVTASFCFRKSYSVGGH